MCSRPAIDTRAINIRYWMSWPMCILYVLAIALIASPHYEILDPDRVERRMVRLQDAARSSDPAVAREAQRRIVELTKDWRYRYRNPIALAPMVLGFVLLIPAALNGMRTSRAHRRALEGRCMDCGYDRRGSGARRACPECGGPPPPLKGQASPTGSRGFLLKRVAMFVALVLFFAAPFIGYADAVIDEADTDAISAAYEAADRVLVRVCELGEEDGTAQYAFLRERNRSFVRQEWWSRGALEQTLVSSDRRNYRRYRPDEGVRDVDRSIVRSSRRRAHRRVDSTIAFELRGLRYDFESMSTNDDVEVYRRRYPAGLHDHHLCQIDIVVIDAASRRPRFVWKGVFDHMLDADAQPTLAGLTMIEIAYPDGPAGPALRHVDPDRPGELYADRPVRPDWLDPDWVRPVVDG